MCVSVINLSMEQSHLISRYAAAGYDMPNVSRPRLSGRCMHVVFTRGAL